MNNKTTLYDQETSNMAFQRGRRIVRFEYFGENRIGQLSVVCGKLDLSQVRLDYVSK